MLEAPMTIRRRHILRTAAGAVTLGAAPAYIGRGSQAAQERTMVLAMPQTPEGFDGDVLRPGTQASVTQVYEGLVRYGRVQREGRTYLNPNQLEPYLAEKWESSGDGKRWVFTLRQGVKIPYGNQLSAADFEWSWAKSFAQKRTGAFIANVAKSQPSRRCPRVRSSSRSRRRPRFSCPA
jgi:ABC-type transport system substrate-binding protein